MKKSKNTFVFKLIFFSLLGVYFNSIFLYISIFIYLLLNDYKLSICYILLVLLILFINNNKLDIIPIGIIDYQNDNYYIVDKLLYKCKLYTDDVLNVGDVLFFKNKFNLNTYDSELNKNILFYGFSYNKLFNFYPRLLIFNQLNKFDSETSAILLKILFNINNYDDLIYNLGYGLASYYLFRRIYYKYPNLSLILLIIYALLFNFQIKFYLIIIDYLTSYLKIDKLNKFSIKILIIYLINSNLFNNYSILIPLLINIYSYIDIKINFNCYFGLLQSLLFGEVSLLTSIFYKLFINIQLFILIISILTLIIPSFNNLYLKIIDIYSDLNSIYLSIRGSLSIIGILLIILITKLFNVTSKNITYLLFLLTIISPLNHPFGHVSFIDVGQGDSTLIKYPLNQGNVLIDTGSIYNYYKLKKYLYSQSIYTIDYLVITHNDSDHNGNIESIKNDFNVKNIIEEGQDFYLKDLFFKYYDLGAYDNDNDNSLVYGVSINNLDYLFTGDISEIAEKTFINKYGPIDFDVLKVSHHGSYTATSKYFVSNILPKYAIISTSGQYGHPASSTTDTLDSYLVDTYITKYDKTVEFYFIYGLNIIKSGLGKFVIIN